MKLEVGMYVRTKHNGIKKIVALYAEAIFTDTNIHIENKDIIGEPSFSIIDLIQKGDYVNGHQVYEVDRQCCRITLNGGSYGEAFRLTYLRPALGENMGIKSIVTKEQFEAMEYRIGE